MTVTVDQSSKGPKQIADPPEPEPPAALAAVGHNQPPEDSPFEAIKAHIDDLYAEAHNWIDGEPIATQGQADAVAKLKGMIAEAEKAADDARRTENEPFDKGKAEVQARYNTLIGKPNAKGEAGKTHRAMEACRKALTPWLERLDREREEAAQNAREEAERIAREARELAAAAVSLDEVEAAEEMFVGAKAATREAASIGSDRARAGLGSGYKATTLRDNWIATITDGSAVLRHYWTTRRADLEAYALSLAQADVRAGKREIPGVSIVNERRAA